jgi:hypothetical protein
VLEPFSTPEELDQLDQRIKELEKESKAKETTYCNTGANFNVGTVYSTTCTSESWASDVAKLSLLRNILLLGWPSSDTLTNQ